MKLLGVLSLFLFAIFSGDRVCYIKKYDGAGSMVEEGWMQNGSRNGYWKFYEQGKLKCAGHFQNDLKTGYWYLYLNGEIASEGRYKEGKQSKWWIFYNLNGYDRIKREFRNGSREGYTLFYKGRSLKKVEEYRNNAKTGSWTNVFSFKRDHPGFSLSNFRE